MKNKVLFAAAIAGFLGGLVAAHVFAKKKPPLPPAFKPAENPFPNGIYSEGIIEGVQGSGSNMNVFPEVGATVSEIDAEEGEPVRRGDVLFKLDDTVPRPQAESALAAMRSAEATLAKDEKAYAADPRSISLDALETQRQTAAAAAANDRAAQALLAKYTVRAPADGVVMQLNAAPRAYVSPTGVYDTYTQGYDPAVVLSLPQTDLQVRCYVDEILVNRLPSPRYIRAQMTVRGTDITIPLQFVRVQPFVSPKIELSDQKQERVDVRVLPVIFRFAAPSNMNIFPGELVDVYIGE